MIIKIDRNIFSDACISKCIYSLSDVYTCNRFVSDNIERIEINPIVGTIADSEIEKDFLQKLNDFKLREIIVAETKDIRTILYAKAFADCEDFNEEDVE